jgi:hypothetical protein
MALPLLKYESLCDTCLDDLPAVIRAAATVRVGALTLDELAEVNDYPNGAYVFYENLSNEVPFYVGRASSRSFLGRIPSHFEQREDYWMNALSKGLHKKRQLPSYADGVTAALGCYVTLIGVHLQGSAPLSLHRKKLINTLELVLQEALKPELNKRPGSLACNLTLGQAVARRAA